MAITKTKLQQLENSVTAGSIATTDSSNILTYVAPSSGVNHLWGYETGGDGTLPILIGTNLSYNAGTNTLNASAGAGGYSDVLNSGSGFTNSSTNTKLNFLGSALTASDGGAGETDLTFATILNTIATAGSVSLSGAVSGTLPVANGGTGATTLTGLLRGNGTGAITAITTSSTVGQVLRVTGPDAYAWGALDLADTDAITGDLPLANLAQGSALSVLGVTGNATADNASIAAGTDHQVLRRSGTALAFGAVNLAQSAAVTGTLAITNGGTGSATQNFVDLSTGQTIGGAKVFSSNITINGTPSAATDAATVGWVLNNVAGLKSGSARGATTSVLTATAQTATTITLGGTTFIHDGVTYANGETILVKDSVTGGAGGTFNNGVYTVGGIGTSVLLTRVAWMDTAGEIDGVYVLIQDGTANVGTLWFTVSEVTTLGTDAISFTQITTSGTIGGTAAANKVTYGSGVNTLTSTTLFHFDGTKLGIGTATPVANNLLTTKGTTADNTAFGYSHLNNADTQVFRVSNNGTTVIGTGTTLTLDSTNVTGSGALNISNSGTLTISPASGNAITMNTGNGGTFSFGSGFTWTGTSGTLRASSTSSAFVPTSGTATFASFAVLPTINQTGGANGISRGILISPTLTAAADFRGLEITANTSHYALFTTAGKVRFDFGTNAIGDLLTRDTNGELVPIAASTSGYVLTSNGAASKPTWQAAASATAVTRAYKTGSTASVFTLNSGTAVTDKDGTNITFTTSGLSADQIVVVLNGIVLSESGTVSRDYTLNTGTSVLTLASALVSTDQLMIYKIV
jgi:hypothetical protein